MNFDHLFSGLRGAIGRAASGIRATMAAVLLACMGTAAFAQAGEPIKVGFSMPLTGGLAANGKAALLAIQIWADDVNAKGGILKRPVRLVHYDDQSSPAQIPGIYTKLLEVDKVDLIVSSYGTALMIPAIPLAQRRNMVLMGMVGVAANKQFNYPGFFQISPAGPEPALEFSRGFFDVAMQQNPKPASVAIVGVDLEVGKVAMDGAREWAKRNNLRVTYDKSYPANIVDLSPVIRAVQATNPDIVYVASYPTDTGNFVRAVKDLDYKPRMLGGGMIGLQYAALKTQLGESLNGIVNYEFYVPEPTMDLPGVKPFLQVYQARADKEGVDPLGFYVPPFVYAAMQILQRGVEGVGSLDHKAMAAYMHKTEFDTVVGKVSFGPDGEWTKGRYLLTQYQKVKGNSIDQFRAAGTNVILYPPQLKSGSIVYPYGGK